MKQPQNFSGATLALVASITLLLSGCDRSSNDESPGAETPSNTTPTPAQAASDTATLADAIYYGGPILTVDESLGTVEAVTVKDGRILAAGRRADLEAQTGAETRRIDLGGRTLVPGFVDGHVHVNGLGLQAMGANLLAPPDGQAETIDDVVEAMTDWAASSDNDERFGWIFGMGYDDAILAEGRHPTRDDLDRVSTERPVIAIHISGHFAAVNSVGLAKIGYTADTPDPAGGVIRRRPGSQEPNGVLEELAAIPVFMSELSPRSPEDVRYVMEQGLELAMSFGYTTAQEGRAFANNHAALAGYAEEVGFPIDVVSYIDYSDTSPLNSEWHRPDYRGGYRVGGIKVTLDGSPQGRTAWRTEPYLLPPEGQDADYAGYPAIPDTAAVTAIIDTAYANDWQLLAHANGDAAIDQMLSAIGAVHGQHPAADRRHTLIHGQYVRMDQLDRMAELDLVASLFPMHTFYWGDWHRQLIGEEKAARISPTRSALDRGIPITSHTDAPVALPNLMQIMWSTVNRVTRSGHVLGPEERLTPEEALKAVTLWGAWQHFEEDEKGSITPGKRADLVVLSDNPLTIEPMKLNEIVVLETIKDGETVWRRDVP